MTTSEYNSVRKTCKYHIMQNGGLHCDHLYNHATICEVDVCPLMRTDKMLPVTEDKYIDTLPSDDEIPDGVEE